MLHLYCGGLELFVYCFLFSKKQQYDFEGRTILMLICLFFATIFALGGFIDIAIGLTEVYYNILL